MKKQKEIIQLKEQEYWLRCDKEGNLIDNEVKAVDILVKEVPRTGFAITYLTTIINMIDSIGNKKMQVVKYVLQNMDSNNKLSETVREISAGSGCSIQTVQETLKLLQDCGIVARKTGTVMLSPKLAHKGNARREKFLMTKFIEIQSSENEMENETDENDEEEKKILNFNRRQKL